MAPLSSVFTALRIFLFSTCQISRKKKLRVRMSILIRYKIPLLSLPVCVYSIVSASEIEAFSWWYKYETTVIDHFYGMDAEWPLTLWCSPYIYMFFLYRLSQEYFCFHQILLCKYMIRIQLSKLANIFKTDQQKYALAALSMPPVTSHFNWGRSLKRIVLFKYVSQP